MSAEPQHVLERPAQPHGLSDSRHLRAGAVSHAVGTTAAAPVGPASPSAPDHYRLTAPSQLEIYPCLVLTE